MKILVFDRLVDMLEEQLSSVLSDFELIPITPDGEIIGDPAGAEILFLPWGLDPERLRWMVSLPDLRWIHTLSAGVDYLLPLLETVSSDVILTNASGVFNVPIAEIVLGYMLSVVKRLPRFWAQQKAHCWKRHRLGELRGMTVGIVGLGDIGEEIARLCQAFGMHVLGVRRMPRPSEYADEVLGIDQLHEVLSSCDFVVLACPLTEETYHLIDAEALAAMKPGAWLINIARGPVVDEQALIEALRSGHLGGACLDVFEQEPLPEESPLWDLPNVLITPHNAGSSTKTWERELALFVENVRRYVQGEPLQNVVDRQKGY